MRTLALALLLLAGLGARTARAEEPPYLPVVTPDAATLPSRLVDGVRVFHLVAEPVRRELSPGLVVDAWGYNGSTPGPTIEAVEGERVRIYVTNRLPEPTAVHWHGIPVPNGMDGVSGMTQAPIPSGETFKYEFALTRAGTFMYHPHFDELVQVGLGMMGFFVVHPKAAPEARADRDFCLFLHEWSVRPGTSRPDPTVMDEMNLFSFNSRVFPGTAPLVARLGQRVRVRIANLSTQSHPIHLHGHSFEVVETDGGAVPPSARFPETTVNVPVGSTRVVEFVADNPGDWALHCHKLHHTMNQMGHGVESPIGVDQSGLEERIRRLLPGYMAMGRTGFGGMMDMPLPPNTIPMLDAPGPFGEIEQGGMFTVLKVREGIGSYEDPGWYRHPPGTVAARASEEEMERDLGPAPGAPAAPPPAGGDHGHHGH